MQSRPRTKEDAHRTLVGAGILTPQGEISDHYPHYKAYVAKNRK